MYETLTFDVDGMGVGHLVLNRPDKHNAMSGAMIAELSDVARELSGRDDLRCVILSANGPSFCAGGDLNWMKAQINGSPDQRRSEARKLAEMLFALNTVPQPLIGRVHGNAFGGGLGLMSICDMTVGVEGAKFGLTETKLGLIPATISPYILARMGEVHARKVFMSSRVFGTSEAIEFGLLGKTVPEDQLDAAMQAEVAPYFKCAPGAVAMSKRLTRMLGPRIDGQVIDQTIDLLIARWEDPETLIGINAFLNKETPPWVVE